MIKALAEEEKLIADDSKTFSRSKDAMDYRLSGEHQS